jgi:hypothetical protein
MQVVAAAAAPTLVVPGVLEVVAQEEMVLPLEVTEQRIPAEAAEAAVLYPEVILTVEAVAPASLSSPILQVLSTQPAAAAKRRMAVIRFALLRRAALSQYQVLFLPPALKRMQLELMTALSVNTRTPRLQTRG